MVKIKALNILTLLLYPLCLFSHQKDLWDGEKYSKNSGSQLTTAQNFLQKLTFKPADRVLDIGCGDGKISAALAKQVPQGFVQGIDISQSMIEYAKKAFPSENHHNLRFTVTDAQKPHFENTFDYAVSFTAIHWIADKKGVVRNTKKALKPGGTLAFSIPLGPPPTLIEAAKAVTKDERWNKYFHNFKPRWGFPKPDEFIALVEAEQLQLLSSDLIEQLDHFPSKEHFKNYAIQWFPYLDPLPEELKAHFLEEVISLYIKLERMESQKIVDFRFRTLEVIARKTK